MLLSNGAFLLVYCNKIVELWTKRNFRCDCGNSKFGEFFCKLFPNKDIENADNSYNHNFKGSYCTCGRPYPDPDAEEQVEMIQCCICEDWFHEEHLGLESSGEVSSLCFHYGSQFFLFLFRCSLNFL
jgi:E3 ubiquitin-protein ligase UBR7